MLVSCMHCQSSHSVLWWVPECKQVFTNNHRSVLCPVIPLRQYVQVTTAWSATDQWFVCYVDHRKGTAVSKDRLCCAKIDLTGWQRSFYSNVGHEVPASVKCHSVCAVATSWAALCGVQLSDICNGATWKTPSTFTRFYKLNVASVLWCLQMIPYLNKDKFNTDKVSVAYFTLRHWNYNKLQTFLVVAMLQHANCTW